MVAGDTFNVIFGIITSVRAPMSDVGCHAADANERQRSMNCQIAIIDLAFLLIREVQEDVAVTVSARDNADP